MVPTLFPRPGDCLVALSTCLCLLLSVRTVEAYTPDDPTVSKMIEGGVRYLEANADGKTFYPLGTAHSGGFGELALAGYAHLKCAHDPDNVVVKNGIKAAQELVRKLSEPDPGTHSSKTIYAASVATLLLAEVDRIKYRNELTNLERFFRRVQYRNGAYGYFGEVTGDVSQVQYVMLAIWTLDRGGFVVDYPGLAKTASWLLRVQDPSGGWPYQAVDPGSPTRVKQGGVTASMAVAGGSAVLIAGDALHLWGGSSGDDPDIEGLPKAVKLKREDIANENVKRPGFDSAPILSAIGECDSWLTSNSPDPGKLASVWPFYQLYTLERYQSFRGVALKSPPEESPEWYNAGVEFLKKQELPNGGWPNRTYTTGPVTTAFALLFLSRSTQRAIEKVNKGALAGGYGLPADTTKITVNGTQIKGEPAATAVTDLLSLLEGDESADLDSNSIPEDLKLATDPDARRSQIARLQRLVRGSRSWQARRVAARLLGQSDDLEVVPALIFALSDPDHLVRRYANDGLSFIGRKFDGYELPNSPTSEDIRRTQNLWREWYLSIRPSYVFLEEGF